jgi:hypothetical protein
MPNELSLPELEQLERSVAATGQLPAPALQALIATCRTVLRREVELVLLLEELTGPWSEVRLLLNRLHNLTDE